MKLKTPAIAVGLLSLCFVSCGQTTAPASPTTPSQASSGIPSGGAHLVATYAATLSASATCADQLPADVRVRQYVAKLFDNGKIGWTGPTVIVPPGHFQVSSGQLSGDSFSLVIGTKEDPQSDNFHGIWDELSASRNLTIDGTGTGTVVNGQITGLLSGNFNYWEGPPGMPATRSVWCGGTDNTFTLTRQ